jgi:hypothetical protein
MITYLAHSPRTSIEHVVLYKYENDALIISETVKFEDLATHITGSVSVNILSSIVKCFLLLI